MCGVGVLLAGCTSADTTTEPVQASTSSTTEAPAAEPPTLRVGIVVNEAATTAPFDEQIIAALSNSADDLTETSGLRIDLRTVSVETPIGTEDAVRSLIDDEVSVIITGCDDETVPSVVQTATTNGLLTTTGCASLPRPAVDRVSREVNDELFIDLSSLTDDARAIANVVEGSLEASFVGVLHSDLFPDVERTCVDLIAQPDDTSDDSPLLSIPSTTMSFTELVDDPTNVVTDLQTALLDTASGDEVPDALVICALPPTIGDVVSGLREAGVDLPIVVPWYGDAQSWAVGTDDVFVVTPASRHGDDPEPVVNDLFAALTTGENAPGAAAVVAADTLSILVAAAGDGTLLDAQRLADTIRDSSAFPAGDIAGLSGPLVTWSGDDPVERVYRVLEIQNGEPQFHEQVR